MNFITFVLGKLGVRWNAFKESVPHGKHKFNKSLLQGLRAEGKRMMLISWAIGQIKQINSADPQQLHNDVSDMLDKLKLKGLGCKDLWV